VIEQGEEPQSAEGAERNPRAMNQRALNRQKNEHKTLNRRVLKEIQRGTAVIEPHGYETQLWSRAMNHRDSAQPTEKWEIQRGTAVFETHGDELQ
jgi:SET domain-containing protein